MDTGDDPNAANPRRRNRGSTRVAASRPPALDDAPISTPLPAIHLGYSRFPEGREFLSRSDNVRACEPARRLGSSATSSQASSSAAPPSDHPGSERAGSRTHVRQSVLYSDRPRRTRHRRPTEHVEHPSEGSTGEHGLDLLTIEALSAIGPAAFRSETEEHPSEVGSSGHGRAVTDLPTLEALSLMNELPLLATGETSEESDAEDVDEEHISGLSTLGTITDLPTIEIMSSASDTREPLEESDYDYDDSDEFEHEMEEYFAANPCVPPRQAFDKISAIEQATLTARAAEWGTEPPSAVIARAALEAQRQQETRSLQAPLQASDGAIQRHEASTEDIVRKGKR